MISEQIMTIYIFIFLTQGTLQFSFQEGEGNKKSTTRNLVYCKMKKNLFYKCIKSEDHIL